MGAPARDDNFVEWAAPLGMTAFKCSGSAAVGVGSAVEHQRVMRKDLRFGQRGTPSLGIKPQALAQRRMADDLLQCLAQFLDGLFSEALLPLFLDERQTLLVVVL